MGKEDLGLEEEVRIRAEGGGAGAACAAREGQPAMPRPSVPQRAAERCLGSSWQPCGP